MILRSNASKTWLNYGEKIKNICISTEKVFILQSVLEMSVLVIHDIKKCQEFVR